MTSHLIFVTHGTLLIDHVAQIVYRHLEFLHFTRTIWQLFKLTGMIILQL